MHTSILRGIVAFSLVFAVSFTGGEELKKSTTDAKTVKTAKGITWETEFEKAWDTAKEEKLPLLLYVSMEGCHYCNKMDRETYANLEVAKDVTESFVAVKVKRNQAQNLVRRYGVSIYPTTVIIHPETRRVETIRGYVGPSQLKSRLAGIRNAVRR
jgi:uncharacterized protein